MRIGTKLCSKKFFASGLPHKHTTLGETRYSLSQCQRLASAYISTSGWFAPSCPSDWPTETRRTELSQWLRLMQYQTHLGWLQRIPRQYILQTHPSSHFGNSLLPYTSFKHVVFEKVFLIIIWKSSTDFEIKDARLGVISFPHSELVLCNSIPPRRDLHFLTLILHDQRKGHSRYESTQKHDQDTALFDVDLASQKRNRSKDSLKILFTTLTILHGNNPQMHVWVERPKNLIYYFMSKR